TYQRVWQGLSESAVFGAEAQHVIAQVRRSLDDADTIATYQRVWQGLSESAVFGAEAQHVIAQVRRSLDVR
ncbi:hypothetical protein ACFCW6_16025, partial [Streptomyces sp. NPDC056333]